jgi:hypothetical protein
MRPISITTNANLLAQSHLSPYLAAMDEEECVPLRSPSRADRSPDLSQTLKIRHAFG